MDALVRLNIVILPFLWHTEIEAGSHHAVAGSVELVPLFAEGR